MHWQQPLYLFILFATFLAGIIRWPLLHHGERIIAVLLGITLLQEGVAYACLKLIKDNLFTYHFYSPVEYLMLCLYFNSRNNLLRKYGAGIWLGIAGIVLAVVNTLYFQPLSTFNSYFLLFEATMVILLCLLSLCEILLADLLAFVKSAYFWICLLLMFYWSITYTGWGVFNLIAGSNKVMIRFFMNVLYLANLLLYTGLAFVFINYKKLDRAAI